MNIYKRVIHTFGEEHQKRIAQEELAELIQALSKDMRGLEHNVEEEIANVIICLNQLKYIYDRKKIDKFHDKKIECLRELLDD